MTLLALTLMVTTFQKGMGNAFFMQADYSLKEWRKAGKVSNKQEYLQSLESINRALAYDSKNPHYYNSKATVIDWGITSGFDEQVVNAQVEELYLRSISLREHWPKTWIELAAVNSYTSGVNEDTVKYMNNAFNYGPFDQDVIRISLNILLSNWDSLNPTLKSRFYQILELSSKNVGLFGKVLNQAKIHQKERLICLQIKFNQAYDRYKNSRLEKQFCG